MARPPAVEERAGPLRRSILRIHPAALGPLLVWLGLGYGLSRLSTRVADWFVMTDELLYERLALSVVHAGSPLPRVHGVLIPNVNQLYPLLLATVYGHGLVPAALERAHLLNAFVMSSAAVPAALLARRATGSRAVALLVAVATVCVPWIVYSSFLLTEVVGYPAFLWALLGIQASVVSPSRRRDLLALLGIALAVAARTQFTLLALVLPVVLLVYTLASASPERRGLRAAARATVERHRLLAGAYGLLLAGGIVLLVLGRVGSILGTYAITLEGNLLPNGLGRSLLAHVAVLALSLGILPFLIGAGWLAASALRPAASERYAFTLTALVTLLALWLEVTIFDLRFGGGVVRDRYLFYVVPPLLIACACGLRDLAWQRRWLLLPTGLAAGGFLVAGLPVFGKLDADTPVSDIDHYLRTSIHSLEGARLTLAAATVLLAALYLRGARLLPRRALGVLVVVFVAVVLPAETWYAWATLFGNPGTSGRPISVSQGSVLDWVDRFEGTTPDVTMLPYPFVRGDFEASLAYWWDLEFWNESVGRAAYESGEFEGTPSTFPKLALSFNPTTGVANISPTRFAVELASETRFRLYGTVDYLDRGAYLIDTGGAWQAQWLTLGLDDDGWTAPGVTTRLRVFPIPFQAAPIGRVVELSLSSPGPPRRVVVQSNAGSWSGLVPSGGETISLPLCQGAKRYTDTTIRVQGSSAAPYGDMSTLNSFGAYRAVGVLVSNIEVADSGGPCTPKA